MGGNTLQGWSNFFQDAIKALSRQPPYGASSLISKDQEVEMGLAPLVLNSNGPLVKMILPVL